MKDWIKKTASNGNPLTDQRCVKFLKQMSFVYDRIKRSVQKCSRTATAVQI